jgi:hypothetical protein
MLGLTAFDDIPDAADSAGLFAVTKKSGFPEEPTLKNRSDQIRPL